MASKLTGIHYGDGSNLTGVNATTLDGINSTGFVRQLSITTNPNYVTPSSRRVEPNASNPTNEHYAVSTFGNNGNVTGQLATHFVNGQAYVRGHNNGWSSWRKLWDNQNDGSGSGLDADKVDGIHASSFLRSDAADTWTGTLTWGGAGGGTALQLTNGDIHGVNKLHINDHGEGIHFGGSSANPHLYSPSGTHLQLQTNSGYLQFGAMNTSWCHFQTDRPQFYMNKGLAVDGNIKSYNGTGTATFARFNVHNPSNGAGAKINFSDNTNYGQNGTIEYVHSDTQSYGSGNAFKFYGTEPSLSFHVAGKGLFTGDVTAYYSDERLKDFSGKIENALDKVRALNGYHYTGNAAAGELGYDTEVQQVGVSAQEVEAVLPEVVKSAPINDDAGTDYMTVQYERLAPLFIEAIKEQQQEIDELKEMIKKLLEK